MFIECQKFGDRDGLNPWFRNACFSGYSEGYSAAWWL